MGGGGTYSVAFEGWLEIEGRLPGKRPGFVQLLRASPAPAGADELPAACVDNRAAAGKKPPPRAPPN